MDPDNFTEVTFPGATGLLSRISFYKLPSVAGRLCYTGIGKSGFIVVIQINNTVINSVFCVLTTVNLCLPTPVQLWVCKKDSNMCST